MHHKQNTVKRPLGTLLHYCSLGTLQAMTTTSQLQPGKPFTVDARPEKASFAYLWLYHVDLHNLENHIY